MLFRAATFWKKLDFSEKQYSAFPPLSGEPLFQSGQDPTFHSRYFFRRATFQNIPF